MKVYYNKHKKKKSSLILLRDGQTDRSTTYTNQFNNFIKEDRERKERQINFEMFKKKCNEKQLNSHKN